MNSKKQWIPFDDRTRGTTLIDKQENYGETFYSRGSFPPHEFNEEHSTFAHIPRSSIREQELRNYQNEIYRSLWKSIKEKLEILRQRSDNWDGKGSKEPNRNALDKAYIHLDSILNAIIDSGRFWKNPFISSNEDGNIIIEWNFGRHELHIEISAESEEYLKVWGTNIESDMHIGPLHSSEYVKLWDWVTRD